MAMHLSTSIRWPYIPNQVSAAALPSMFSSQRLEDYSHWECSQDTCTSGVPPSAMCEQACNWVILISIWNNLGSFIPGYFWCCLGNCTAQNTLLKRQKLLT